MEAARRRQGSTQETLAELRSLFYDPPSQKIWSQICALIDALDDAGRTIAVDYARVHLKSWPDSLRRMPERWWRGLLRDDGSCPQSQLARVRRLWPSQELSDERVEHAHEEKAWGDWTLNMALIHVALSGDMSQLILADAAEWHHAGGDILSLPLDAPSTSTSRRSLPHASMLMSANEYHGEACALRFSPDGRWTAAAIYHDGVDLEVILWDHGARRWSHQAAPGVAFDEPDGAIGGFEFSDIAFSPASDLVVFSSRYEHRLTCLELNGLHTLGATDCHGILTLGFSKDGTRLAAGHVDGSITVRDPHALHHPALVCVSGRAPVLNVALAGPEGPLVAARDDGVVEWWSYDDTLRAWCQRGQRTLERELGVGDCDMVPLNERQVRLLLRGHDVLTILDLPEGLERSLTTEDTSWEAVALAQQGRVAVFGHTQAVWAWWL